MASKKSETKEELAKVQPMLPATANDLAGYGDYSAGEQLDAERVMPVLQLIQANSKALVKTHEKYVKGATAGQLFNRATGLLKDSVVFVPCAREHVYVEWIPIEQGGGKVATYRIDDPMVMKLRAEQGFGKLLQENGNEVQETFYVYGYALDENEEDPVPEPAVLAVKGSSITPYKHYFNNVRSFLVRDAEGKLVRGPNGKPVNPPMFAHRIRVGSQPVSRKGHDFIVFTFSPANGDMASSLVPAAMLDFGKRIAEDYAAGRTKLEEEDVEDAGAASGGTSVI